MDEKLPMVNADAQDWTEVGPRPRYGGRRKQLGAAAGGRELGCSLMELAAGQRSWPLHWHAGNEEAIYVLEGSATLQLAGKEVPLRAGDYVALRPEADSAHQIVNTSNAPFRYLVLSTMKAPDVVVYPDSRKVVVFAGAAPGGSKAERTLSLVLSADATVDYWDGE